MGLDSRPFGTLDSWCRRVERIRKCTLLHRLVERLYRSTSTAFNGQKRVRAELRPCQTWFVHGTAIRDSARFVCVPQATPNKPPESFDMFTAYAGCSIVKPGRNAERSCRAQPSSRKLTNPVLGPTRPSPPAQPSPAQPSQPQPAQPSQPSPAPSAAQLPCSSQQNPFKLSITGQPDQFDNQIQNMVPVNKTLCHRPT